MVIRDCAWAESQKRSWIKLGKWKERMVQIFKNKAKQKHFKSSREADWDLAKTVKSVCGGGDFWERIGER